MAIYISNVVLLLLLAVNDCLFNQAKCFPYPVNATSYVEDTQHKEGRDDGASQVVLEHTWWLKPSKVRCTRQTLNYEFSTVGQLPTEKHTMEYVHVELNTTDVRVDCPLNHVRSHITVRLFSPGKTVVTHESEYFLMDNTQKITVNATKFAHYFTKMTVALGVIGECDYVANFLCSDDRVRVVFSSKVYGDHGIHQYLIKRQIEDETPSRSSDQIEESLCQLQTKWVNFADLEIGDSVIRPLGFNINYCVGMCSFPQALSLSYNTTKHSHIQTIAAHYNPSHVPTACCVPHEYRNVDIIFQESPDIVSWHTLVGISAMSCGCH